MEFKTLINNPLKLFLWWMFFELLFVFIGIPILNIGHTGGEQIPLIFFSYSFEIFIYGFLVICIITPILFLQWSEKYWYISLIVGVVFLVILIAVLMFNFPLQLLHRVITNFKSVYLSGV